MENPRGGHPQSPGSPHDLPLLLERLKPRIDRILAYFRVPPCDAQDLLQNLALQTFQRWSEIEQHESWFIVTLRKRCLVYHRDRRLADLRYISLEILDQYGDLARELPTVPSPADRLEIRVDLRRLLRNISATQRILLAARYRLGMVDHDTAQLTGLAAGSIRKLISRALARLRAAALRKGSVPNRAPVTGPTPPPTSERCHHS